MKQMQVLKYPEVNQLYKHVIKTIIKPNSVKARYVKIEVINDIGRFITPDEFKWLMNYFENRIDYNRLAMALAYCAGLRIHDAVNVKISAFDKEFKDLQMAQCKAHISKKDGVIRSKASPRNVPLPEWLSEDLRFYIKQSYTRTFRGQTLMIGKDGHTSDRLFPFLNKASLRATFQSIRRQHGAKNRWLRDVWQIIKGYDRPNGRLLWERTYYRISCHAFRAAYCTFAYEASGQNLLAAKRITGHSETRHLEKYAKTFEIQQKKEEVKQRLNEVMGYKSDGNIPEIEIENVNPLELRKQEAIDYEMQFETKLVRIKNISRHSWKKLMKYCVVHRKTSNNVIKHLILEDFLLDKEIKKVLGNKKELVFDKEEKYNQQSIQNMDRKIWKFFLSASRNYNKKCGHILSYLIDSCL